MTSSSKISPSLLKSSNYQTIIGYFFSQINFIIFLSTHSNKRTRYCLFSSTTSNLAFNIIPSPPDGIGEGLYLLNKTVPSSVPPCFRRTNKSRNL